MPQNDNFSVQVFVTPEVSSEFKQKTSPYFSHCPDQR